MMLLSAVVHPICQLGLLGNVVVNVVFGLPVRGPVRLWVAIDPVFNIWLEVGVVAIKGGGRNDGRTLLKHLCEVSVLLIRSLFLERSIDRCQSCRLRGRRWRREV